MIVLTLLLWIVWIGLTGRFFLADIAVGGVVAFAIAFTYSRFFKLEFSIKPLKIVRYALLFLKELIKANIEVVKIVLSPKIDIQPSILNVPTSLDDEFKRFILANTITLTPGTISIDVDDTGILVHVLDGESVEIKKFEEILAL